MMVHDAIVFSQYAAVQASSGSIFLLIHDDGVYHDYFPVLVKDAVFTQCPPVTVEATVWNVENIFGWVTTTGDLLSAFGGSSGQ